MRVLAGMSVWRTIAAESDAALLAGPQMYPACPNLHALLAFAPLWLFNGRDRVEMRATSVRHRF
jgi:hypothetical protein